jgi:hypothetical protein
LPRAARPATTLPSATAVPTGCFPTGRSFDEEFAATMIPKHDSAKLARSNEADDPVNCARRRHRVVMLLSRVLDQLARGAFRSAQQRHESRLGV